GTQAAVVPDQLQGGEAAARGELISDHASEWVSFLVHAGRGGFNTDGGSEFERAEHWIEVMARDVAEGAGAKIPPPSPLGWKVSRVIRPGGSRSEPKIP